MTNLDQFLLEQSLRYGSFQDVANRTTKIFGAILHNAPQTPSITPLYMEALHMISAKLARLVNGQINDLDSWHDIAGYALLIYNQIMADSNAKADAKAAEAPQSAPNPLPDKTDSGTMVVLSEKLAQDLKKEW